MCTPRRNTTTLTGFSAFDMKIVEYNSKTAISKSNLPELDYAVNPYSGCQHRCIYCFAIDFTRIDEARENWGKVVYVKANLIEALKKQIKGMKRGITGISTVTDAYQPAEARYKLTRQAVKLILENGFRVTVQTKSPLAARDIDIFTDHKKTLDIGVTITTLDKKKALEIETQTPAPSERIKLLEKLHQAGLKTWIFIGPIIHGFNDSLEDLEEIFEIAQNTDSRVIYDYYSSYKNSSEFMKREFSDKHENLETAGSARWRMDLKNSIESFGKKYGVRTNSQKDEWKVARGEGINKLI